MNKPRRHPLRTALAALLLGSIMVVDGARNRLWLGLSGTGRIGRVDLR